MLETFAYRCTAFYRAFAAYTSQRLQELGLSFGVLFLLVYVGKHPGCTQGELTLALKLDWGYCQRSVVKLVEDGFLLRERQGRAYHLDLSEKGKRAFSVAHQVFSDWDEQVLAPLSGRERETLMALMKKADVEETKEGTSDLCMRPF